MRLAGDGENVAITYNSNKEAADKVVAKLTAIGQKAMIERTAPGRLGQPSDIADVFAFLASEDGRWVTGHTISADGGLNI